MSAYVNADKMYTYIKGFAMGKSWNETLKALTFARKLHEGQNRKSGEPYIIHPLTLACHALSLGVREDNIISTLIYHDVVEDCSISINDLPCNEMIRNSVNLLTFKKPQKYLEKDNEGPSLKDVKSEYYKEISNNLIASISKIFDRCHNVSSMAGVFTKTKVYEYIEETKEFVLPLIRKTKDNYPEYQDILFVLKYHIISVLDAIEGTIKTFDVY